jgi:hypothetical protein
MTEWYCHFDPNEFAQAKRVQENLLRAEGPKPVKAGEGDTPIDTGTGETETAGTMKVLPFPGRKRTAKQKQA